MNHSSSHGRCVRRTPVLGVSGVTLLMLVTMVLTTSPAFGRTSDLGVTDGRSDQTMHRVAPTDGAGHRLGGRRQYSSNQVRPVGGGAIMAMSRPERTAAAACGQVSVAMAAPVLVPADRIGEAMLNLPPPGVG